MDPRESGPDSGQIRTLEKRATNVHSTDGDNCSNTSRPFLRVE